MNACTKLRGLERVVCAALIGTLVSAVPLRLLASTVPLVTFVVTVGAGACVGAAIGAGSLRFIVATLRTRSLARWRLLAAAALLLGGIFAGIRLWSSSRPFIIALRYGNVGLQSWAESMLRERGPDAIPGLFVILKDKDAHLRLRAAKLLGEVDPPAVTYLLQAMEHEDPEVRAEAAKALGRIAASRGLGAEGERVAIELARALRDEHKETGCTCNGRLRRFGYDVHWELRKAAARALQNIKPPPKEAVPALIEIMRTGDLTARRLATQVLASMASVAEDAIPVLIEALRDPDEQIRLYALNALRFMGPGARDAVPVLIDSLSHPDVWFRNAVADTLRHIDPASAVARLVKDLEHTDPSHRVRSAWALGKIGNDARDAIPALIRALHDPDEEVRQGADDAIKQIDGLEGAP